MTSPSTPEAAVAVSMATDDIALLTMDLPGTGANILNDQLFAELDQAMESLAQRDDLIGVILLSAKPSIFVAGADLNNIVAHLDWSDKEIIRFCERGRAVMARFSRCPFPSVAAIHGACVGGGLELALWCDHRIATDHRRTLLGLPEVKLGLVPGWAGTARLPRIAGLEHAADLVTSGRLVDGAEAKSMGFVDEVVSQDRLVESAIAMIGRTHTSRAFVTDRKSIMGPVPGIDPDDSESAIEMIKSVVETVGERIVSNRDIFLYAPTVVLEHMTRTAATGIKQAWDSESMAMAQVWGSPASRGLLNHFFLVDRNKKSPGLVDLSIQSPVLDTVGIVGAGVMGAAIAETCVAAGQHVRLLDADQEVARRAAAAMQPAAEKSGGSIEIAESYSDLVDRNLVIESVVETLDVKRLVLEKISAVVPDSTGSDRALRPLDGMKPTVTTGRFTNYAPTGWTLTVFAASLLFGLVLYTASFIAEIVRGGILAVHTGQTEAASALGLSRAQALRFVILPQAFRVIMPPLGNQYLNITKNTSLAIAVGLSDIVQVGQSVYNKNNQTLAVFGIWMAFFLTLSLTISAVVNFINGRLAIVER